MNPEQGSLMRVVAHSALTSGFSTQRSVPGFKLINNNYAAGQNDYCPGAAAGAGNVPAILS
jgi:hypothetical protein